MRYFYNRNAFFRGLAVFGSNFNNCLSVISRKRQRAVRTERNRPGRLYKSVYHSVKSGYGALRQRECADFIYRLVSNVRKNIPSPAVPDGYADHIFFNLNRDLFGNHAGGGHYNRAARAVYDPAAVRAYVENFGVKAGENDALVRKAV